MRRGFYGDTFAFNEKTKVSEIVTGIEVATCPVHPKAELRGFNLVATPKSIETN